MEIRSVKWFKVKKNCQVVSLRIIFVKEIIRNPFLKENVNIRQGKRNFHVYIPVITISEIKTAKVRTRKGFTELSSAKKLWKSSVNKVELMSLLNLKSDVLFLSLSLRTQA